MYICIYTHTHTRTPPHRSKHHLLRNKIMANAQFSFCDNVSIECAIFETHRVNF